MEVRVQVVEEVGRVVAEVRWRLGMKGTGQRKSTQGSGIGLDCMGLGC